MPRSDKQSTFGQHPEGKSLSARWQAAVLIIILSYIVILGLFWSTFTTIVEIWAHSRTFAHGFLVLPAVLYLIWCYRDRVITLTPVPSYWGMLLLVVLGGEWLAGYLSNSLFAQQVAVVAMLPCLVWGAIGTAAFRVLLLPLGFLVFALPFGTSVEPWLQDFTASFVVAGLYLARVPVLLEGMLITIPSGTWQVEPDCGGLRYVLPGLALAYLFAAVMYRQPLRRLGFMSVCVAVLILANGLRAYGIILGDHFGITSGTDHRVFSYAIYGMTRLLLFRFGLKWEEHDPHGETSVGRPDSDRRLLAGQTALMVLGAVLLAFAPLAL